jgi:hypothetical protein
LPFSIPAGITRNMASPETVGALVPHELNPRQITDEQLARLKKSMVAYGDIGGIVFNRRTKKQVGGHQRCKVLDANSKINCKYFEKPDSQGTVGVGFITDPQGIKFAYREVDWPKEIEYAAMIAANSQGGDWDDKALRQVLVLLSESEDVQVDPDTIGLEEDFTAKLFRGQELELNVQEQEQKGLENPLTSEEIQKLPSQTAMVQLFFTVKTRPGFIEVCKKLQLLYGTANITDTVEKAIYELAEQKSIRPST